MPVCLPLYLYLHNRYQVCALSSFHIEYLMCLYLLDSSAETKVISAKPLPKDTIDNSTGTEVDGKLETSGIMGAEDDGEFETDGIGTGGDGKLETGIITQTDNGTDKFETVRHSNTNVLPLPLTELYDIKYCALSQKALAEKADELFINLKISEIQRREIERATREQRNCTEWQQQRKGHITASNFHDILTAKGISESLFKKFTTERNLNYIPAVKWGIDNENMHINTIPKFKANFCYVSGSTAILLFGQQ